MGGRGWISEEQRVEIVLKFAFGENNRVITTHIAQNKGF